MAPAISQKADTPKEMPALGTCVRASALVDRLVALTRLHFGLGALFHILSQRTANVVRLFELVLLVTPQALIREALSRVQQQGCRASYLRLSCNADEFVNQLAN
jgi:hypothetical protein